VSTITVRELARNTAAVIQEVESSGRPALVTRNGRPVAALVAVDQAALEDWLLARAPGFDTLVSDSGADIAVRGDWQKARDSTGGRLRSPAETPPENLRGSHRGD